jgi:hypothetical protein
MCSQPFAKDDFWDTWEGMLAHTKCMPNPVCAICRKPIEDKTIIIDGKTAHEVGMLFFLFVCLDCGVPRTA